MGAAKEHRDRKHFREMFDRESAQHQASSNRAAEYENTMRRNECLLTQVDELRAELAEAKLALKLEMAAHDETTRQADQAAQIAYQAMTSLRRSYSEVSEQLFKVRPLTKHEGMLLICEDGGYVLVHRGAGGLGSFATLDDARQWAARHDGFIPRIPAYDSFHGTYYRVGFNIWP